MRLQVESTTASQPSASVVRERRRAGRVDGDALPQLDGCLAVRDADESESHEAKWVRGRTIGDEGEPGDEQHGEPAPAQAHLAAQDEPGRVERPDRERDGHRDVEVAAVEARRGRRRCPPRARRARRARCGRRAGRATRAAAAGAAERLCRAASAGAPARGRGRRGRRRASARRGPRASGRRGARAASPRCRVRRARRCRRRPRPRRAALPPAASPRARAAGSAGVQPQIR